MNEEYDEDEAHYFSVLASMAEMMLTHGTEQVLYDLLDISMELKTVDSKSVN
tara:strand:- start:168 stop:323 length:156 start_codon:yes stop_codon:yes gene_type:complete